MMQHGAALSERVRDETAGSDLGFLPLVLQSQAGLGWAGCCCWPGGGGQLAGPEQRRRRSCLCPHGRQKSPSWERLMVAVGKPAPIQHFICLYNSRNVSFPPRAAAAFTSDVKCRQLRAPALRQAGMHPFFFFFFSFVSCFKL